MRLFPTILRSRKFGNEGAGKQRSLKQDTSFEESSKLGLSESPGDRTENAVMGVICNFERVVGQFLSMSPQEGVSDSASLMARILLRLLPWSASVTETKIMKDAYFLSRAYVEFGPFPAAEMLGFFDRGLLKETDYILGESTKSNWLHLIEWVTLHRPPAKAGKPKVVAVKKVAVKETLGKAAPVKKAVKKPK